MCFSRKAFCNYSAVFYFLSKAHGFEILCSKSGQSSSEKEPSVSSNPLWRGFLDSLKTNGYFKVGKSFCAHNTQMKQMMQRFLGLRWLIANKHIYLFMCVDVFLLMCLCIFVNPEWTGRIRSIQSSNDISREFLHTVCNQHSPVTYFFLAFLLLIVTVQNLVKIKSSLFVCKCTSMIFFMQQVCSKLIKSDSKCVLLKRIYVSNKSSSFELSIHSKILKKMYQFL